MRQLHVYILVVTASITALIVAGCGSDASTPTPPLPTRLPPVPLGQSFTLHVGEGRLVQGDPAAGSFLLTLNRVFNDSRCPTDVTCIRAGEAFATLTTQADGQQPSDFTLKVEADGNGHAEFNVYDIVATEFLPAPLSTVAIDPNNYVLTVAVSVRL